MYPSMDGLPQPLKDRESLDDLDDLAAEGDINETPFNVFIGHNLGHRVFTMSVPFRQFYELSDVANDRETGPVAQRPLDKNHARNLAKYMLRGLVSAAMLRRNIQSKEQLPAFDKVLEALGNQPYFSLQPMVCNVRNIPYGGNGPGGYSGHASTSRAWRNRGVPSVSIRTPHSLGHRRPASQSWRGHGDVIPARRSADGEVSRQSSGFVSR